MQREPATDEASVPTRARGAQRALRAWIRRSLVLAIFAAWGGTAWWHSVKPLPDGLSIQSPWVTLPAADARFIADVTSADAYGRPSISQGIFDEALRIVGGARQFIVLDFFLFNEHGGSLPNDGMPRRGLAHELRDALIAARRTNPAMQVILVTDPINDVYGGDPSPQLAALRSAGVEVVVTDLDRLRDSNLVYSPLWRLGMSWWSDDDGAGGWLPNPLDEGAQPLTLRAWGRLVNFKANHRKVLIADDGRGGLVGLVTSANPHDASSAHSNVALRLAGPALQPLLWSEIRVARFSGWKTDLSAALHAALDAPAPSQPVDAERSFLTGRTLHARMLTEGGISDALLEKLASAGHGDQIDIAMFYLSDRDVIEALLAASRRGAEVRLLLDPNKDAFGHQKDGVPNRPVATELFAASDGRIKVRWYRTHGEQFHSKLAMISVGDETWMTLGSANLTRRNIDDYNLEANVALQMARTAPLATEVRAWFETLWSNRAPLGTEYSADFGVYSDPAQTTYWRYRIMEATGLSTF